MYLNIWSGKLLKHIFLCPPFLAEESELDEERGKFDINWPGISFRREGGGGVLSGQQPALESPKF